MKITVDSINTSLTITFDPEEWKVMQRVQQQSSGEFKRVTELWLTGHAAAIKADLIRIVSNKIETASVEQLRDIKKVLGL